MYNGLLRFNKHILNELAEGLKHLPNLDGVSNKKAGYNSKKGSNDKAVRVLLLGSCAFNGSLAKSGSFDSRFVRSNSSTGVGFFTTVKLD